jgi:hypothetical protein
VHRPGSGFRDARDRYAVTDPRTEFDAVFVCVAEMRINEYGGIDRRERLATLLRRNADAKNHLLVRTRRDGRRQVTTERRGSMQAAADETRRRGRLRRR